MAKRAEERVTGHRGNADRSGPVVVVGYDGSAASRAALSLAARRAGRAGKVWIIHAYNPPLDFLASPGFDHAVSEPSKHGRALLDAIPLTGNDELIDTDYETELIEGPPAEAIAHMARICHADEIVVGSRGLGSVRALLGSVSHELLRIADRPVVVVPARSGK